MPIIKDIVYDKTDGPYFDKPSTIIRPHRIPGVIKLTTWELELAERCAVEAGLGEDLHEVLRRGILELGERLDLVPKPGRRKRDRVEHTYV